jgi:hypothetical protein
VYTVIWFTSLVLKRTPDGVQTTLPFTGLQQPAGIAVDGDGTVYVTDTGHARVVKLTTGGVQSTVAFAGIAQVSGIAVDSAGNLFISADGGRVVEMASDGTQSTLGFTGIAGASSVAVDPLGNVYLLDYISERVVELTAGGTQVTLGFTELVRPWGLAVDPSGNVLVTAHAPSGGLVELPRTTHFEVIAPASANSGSAFDLSVTALDDLGVPVAIHRGKVHVTASDADAVLPADAGLTGGTAHFAVTLNSPGDHTVTAMDTLGSSITGTSGPITVGAAVATTTTTTTTAASSTTTTTAAGSSTSTTAPPATPATPVVAAPSFTG